MNATNTLVESMKNTSKIMGKMNEKMNLEETQKILQNYQKESEKMVFLIFYF
jgi:hypothetical protein